MQEALQASQDFALEFNQQESPMRIFSSHFPINQKESRDRSHEERANRFRITAVPVQGVFTMLQNLDLRACCLQELRFDFAPRARWVARTLRISGSPFIKSAFSDPRREPSRGMKCCDIT
jgi:hypothetical protein